MMSGLVQTRRVRRCLSIASCFASFAPDAGILVLKVQLPPKLLHIAIHVPAQCLACSAEKVV